jgi:hypothetical protein
MELLIQTHLASARALYLLVIYIFPSSISALGYSNDYVKDVRPNLDFTIVTRNFTVVGSAQMSWTLSCAAACNADAQCVGFSNVKTNVDASTCKTTRSGTQQTQVATKSTVWWRCE